MIQDQTTTNKKDARASIVQKTALTLFAAALFASASLPLAHAASVGDSSSPSVVGRGKSSKFDAVFSKLGPYSPYQDNTDSKVDYKLPHGCEVSQVTILQRHGARYPTKNANKAIQSALAKLNNFTAAELPSEFRFLDGYAFDGFLPDDLTDFGRKEAYDAGTAAHKRYKKLTKRSALWTRASGEARVVESGRQFIQGFNGDEFFASNVSALPELNMTISEDDGVANSLDPSTCAAEDALNPNPGDVAEDAWLAVYAAPIAKRLNNALPGANLTTTNVNSLMSLCGFDSLRSVTLVKSPWCDAFTTEEWKQNEYYFDVSKYYGHGRGAPFGKINGASYINELFARLTDSDTVVQAGVTNMSLISPPGGERIFADFSHDNSMVEILSNLDFLKDSSLPTTKLNPPSHNFVVSKIVPFSGRFHFERVICSGTRFGYKKPQTFVRTLVSNAIQTTEAHSDGLIPLATFLKSVSFAQNGGDWEKCSKTN